MTAGAAEAAEGRAASDREASGAVGAAEGREASDREASGAVAALQTALAAEQAASYGYGIVGSHLTGSAFNLASADCVVHERARDSLTKLITSSGATPQPAAAAYQLPLNVSDAADAAKLAVDLELEVVTSYVELAAVPDPRLRLLAARSMQNACVRAARWGARSQPFPGLAS